MSGIPTLSAQPLTGAAAPSIVPYRPAGAEQMQQFGAAVQGFGKVIAQEADQLQDKLDESSAMAGLRDFAERQRAILRDPTTGYLGTVGQNAVAQRAATIQALEEARKEVAGTLGSQQAQALFARQADVRMSEAAWDIDGHAGREAREFDVQETSRTIDLYADEAVEWYGRSDPGGTVGMTYKQRRQSALDQFDRLASLRGVSKKSLAYQDLRRKVSGKIAAGVTAKLLEVDPDKAWGFLREARKEGDLDRETDRSLSAAVQTQSDLKAGQDAARKALESAGNRGWQAMLRVQDAGLAPGVLKEAQRTIKERSDAIEEGRSAVKADTLDKMRTWAIDNGSAGWQEWEKANPEEATFVRSNGLLDEVVEYFGSDKRGANNPATVAELMSKPDAYWRTVSPNQFLADHGRNLDEKTRNGYLTRIRDEKQAQQGGTKGVSNEEDRNKLALIQVPGQITYYMNTMTQESATKLLAFNIKVDELAASFPESEPAAERYRKARTAALLDTTKDPKTGRKIYRWERNAEEQATLPALNAEGEAVSVQSEFASMSAPEIAKVMASFGTTLSPQDLEARTIQLKADLDGSAIDPGRHPEVLAKAIKDMGLPPGTSPSQLVQGAIAVRKQGLDARENERKAKPGMMSLDRLARGFGMSVEDLRKMVSESATVIHDDDLAFGTATEFGFGKEHGDRNTDPDAIVGISRAAADRALPVLERVLGRKLASTVQSVASAQDRVKWLQALPAQIANTDAVQEERDRLQLEIDDLDEDEQGSPHANELQTQVAMLDIHIRSVRQPDPEQVSEAWEAWLQLGGEVYEAPGDMGMALRASKAPVPVPEKFRQFQTYGIEAQQRDRIQRHLDAVRPRYAALPSIEQHREMKSTYDRFRKPDPEVSIPTPVETGRPNITTMAALRRWKLESTTVERTETIKRMSQEIDVLTEQFGSDDYAVSTLMRARDDLQQLQQELSNKAAATSEVEVEPSTGPYGPHPALGAEHADTVIKGGEKWRSRMADDYVKNDEARRRKMDELSRAAAQIMSRPMNEAAIREVSKIRAQYQKLEGQEKPFKDAIARFRGENAK